MADSIERVGKIGPSSQVDKTVEKGKVSADADHFQNLMNQRGEEVAAADRDPAQQPNLMDEISKSGSNHSAHRKSTEDLLSDTERAIGNIETIRQRLSTEGLKLDPTAQFKMRNNLSHIEDSLKIALDKTGADFPAVKAEKKASASSTIERFLNMLSDSQDRLTNLGGVLQTMNNSKETISPAQMLLVQMKVNYVQQELEFFTNALNKSLESTKTLMNVQV